MYVEGKKEELWKGTETQHFFVIKKGILGEAKGHLMAGISTFSCF